jgi:3-deoxy-D-manno-octulosonic-acid transferase
VNPSGCERRSRRSPLSRALRVLYNGLLLPVYASMWLAYWLVPRRKGSLEWRLAIKLLPPRGRRAIWFHAASVGEVSTIAPVVVEVMRARPGTPVVVSTMTPTGARRAAEKLSQAEITLVPFDFAPSMKRFVSALEPSCLIIAETEIWPNLIGEAKRFGAHVALVNGRISEKSYPRYRRVRALVRDVLDDFDLLLMRSQVDADRIVNLGADPLRVQVAGNTKYDILPAPMAAADRARLRGVLGCGEDMGLVTLGSAREGEAEVLLRAMAAPGMRARTRAIIAPRHLEQVPQIEQACDSAGFTYARITELAGPSDRSGALPEVLILARMGLLMAAYGISDVAVVGGTFKPFGGHNPLEPASQGCVTLVGPHIENIRDDIEYLAGRSCAFVVDEAGLGGRLAELLAGDGDRKRMGEAAIRAVADKKGIAAGCVRIMLERDLLPAT